MHSYEHAYVWRFDLNLALMNMNVLDMITCLFDLNMPTFLSWI